jgi:2-amino-4-hydroxy-6-hydroxymethyldihydropteridine diphosphokinase
LRPALAILLGVTRSYVGLGSNLGDREAFLVGARAALAATRGVSVVAASRLYETEPVGPPQGRYLNAVVALDTNLTPRALLERLLELEDAAGRQRIPQRNAPRTLDLDLLLFGDVCIDTPELSLPHPRLHERAFVLVPLAEVATDLVHPRLGVRLRDLAERAPDAGGVVPWPAAHAWTAG